jgi:hypothetical protein
MARAQREVRPSDRHRLFRSLQFSRGRVGPRGAREGGSGAVAFSMTDLPVKDAAVLKLLVARHLGMLPIDKDPSTPKEREAVKSAGRLLAQRRVFRSVTVLTSSDARGFQASFSLRGFRVTVPKVESESVPGRHRTRAKVCTADTRGATVHVPGSVGVWECGSVGVWECGSVGVWECECVSV